MNASFSFHKSKYSHRTYRFSLLSNFRRIFQSVQLQYSNSSDTLKPTMSASREAFTCNPKSTEPTNCSWNSRPKSTSKTSMEANKKAKHARNAMVDCRLEYAASQQHILGRGCQTKDCDLLESTSEIFTEANFKQSARNRKNKGWRCQHMVWSECYQHFGVKAFFVQFDFIQSNVDLVKFPPFSKDL